MPTDPALDLLRQDAEAQGPRLIAECHASHRHGAIPCYEVRYGIMLSQRPREVPRLLEHDRPVFADPNIGADPADIAVARETLAEAAAAADPVEDAA